MRPASYGGNHLPPSTKGCRRGDMCHFEWINSFQWTQNVAKLYLWCSTVHLHPLPISYPSIPRLCHFLIWTIVFFQEIFYYISFLLINDPPLTIVLTTSFCSQFSIQLSKKVSVFSSGMLPNPQESQIPVLNYYIMINSCTSAL